MSASFVTSGFCLFVLHASFVQISLRDLCRRLHARLTSAKKFEYFENRYHESSSRRAPLRTAALHAMYDTVHRSLSIDTLIRTTVWQAGLVLHCSTTCRTRHVRNHRGSTQHLLTTVRTNSYVPYYAQNR